MSRVRQARRFVRGTRRVVEWIDNILDNQSLTVASGVQEIDLLDSSIDGDSKKGMNLRRLLIDILVRPVNAGASRVHFGIAMVPADMSAAAAHPDPHLETDQGIWVWKGNITHERDIDAGPQGMQKEWDIKSNRRWPGEGYFLGLYANCEGIDCTVDSNIRMLIAKH